MIEKEHNHKEEDCPLCETSKEAIDKLNLPDKSNIKKDAQEEKDESTQHFKIIFISLVIFFGAYAVYAFWPGARQTQVASYNPGRGYSFLNTALAPDFSASDIYGNEFNLSDFRNKKPVLLVFWATWCRYCAKELPDLKIFTEKYQDEIQVIAVDSGETRETIREYIQEKDVNFLMLLDEQKEIWNTYLVRGTPSHFLIDQEGKIITLMPGLASLSDLEIMLSML